MSGPGVGWYLIVAALLFGIGALGVMLRRSPLIVLLSLGVTWLMMPVRIMSFL